MRNSTPGGTGVGVETAPAPRVRRRPHRLIFTALMLSVLGYTFAQAIVAPALPAIERGLRSSVSTTAFVLTGFLLTASVATPIIGSLGDMFGKKRMLLVTMYALAAGSLLCALGGGSIGLLIAGRALQGISAGAVPVSFAIIREEFPEERVPFSLGAVSAGFGIGGGAGVVAGGLIVDGLGYVWIFWFALAVAVTGVLVAHACVPPARETHPARVDWPGALLLAGWLGALLLAIGQGDGWGWRSPVITGLLVAAGVLFLVWIGYGFRAREPLVDMRIMVRRTVLITNVVSLLTGFALFAAFLLIPQFVQVPAHAGYGFGASATAAGLFQLPQSLVLVVSGPLGGQLGGRYGARLPLVLGSLFSAGAFAMFAFAHDQPWPLYAGSGVLGVGLGFAFAAMPNLIVGAVDRGKIGVSTGMNFVLRTVGSALGGQIVASILTTHPAPGTSLPTESGYVIAFLTTTAILVVAFAAGLLIRDDRTAAAE